MTDDDLELMGTAEVAALLDLTRQRVLQLSRENKRFPAPVAVLKMGNVWRGADIRRWAEENRRSKRLPPRKQAHPETEHP